jgi:hypothetical protein
MFMSIRICIPIHNRRLYRCSTSNFINWYCTSWHLLWSSTLPLCTAAPSKTAFLAVTLCAYIGNTATKIICQGLCLLQKRILLCFMFCILHPIKGLFWDLPKRWDRTAQKSRLVLPWEKSSYITHNSGLSLHRNNFATFGLPRMIPDERGTIFGHGIRTTPWERTDILTFVYCTHVGTYLLIKI